MGQLRGFSFEHQPHKRMGPIVPGDPNRVSRASYSSRSTRNHDGAGSIQLDTCSNLPYLWGQFKNMLRPLPSEPSAQAVRTPLTGRTSPGVKGVTHYPAVSDKVRAVMARSKLGKKYLEGAHVIQGS